jgi:uncharacterized Zn finger protein
VSCPDCGGPVILLGRLGRRDVCRCRNCGITWHQMPDDDNADDRPCPCGTGHTVAEHGYES